MTFPEDSQIIQILYWLINTAGVGGATVGLIGGGSILAYALTLWWIIKGGEAPETEIFAYPTPSLHEHGEE